MFKPFGFFQRQVFSPSQMFMGGWAGFLPDLSIPALNLQTAGGAQAANAGDPIGQWLAKAGTLTLAQSTSANRGTRARRPRSGIRNLFTTTTDTFSTRTFTTQAKQYTFSFKGTGTVTLSGTSTAGPLTGTGANNRVSLTFTPTAGTLTLTLSGSATEAQIEFGASATAYQSVASASDITESGQPDVWHTLWDGVSDFGTFGVQSFSTASLFAAAGQAWTVWGVFRTIGVGNFVTIAKCSSTAANKTLQIFSEQSSSQKLSIICRGAANTVSASSVADGAFHVWALRWDGTTLKFWLDATAASTVPVGTAAEEAENITVGARTSSSPAAFFNGHNDAAMVDYAASDGQMAQLMSYLNSTYRAGL